MSVAKKNFGKNKKGQDVTLYSIENKNGMTAQVMDFGAILVNLLVPDKNGKIDDIVLGYDKIEDYYTNGSFFGATVGPSANRIADAKFVIDGVTYNIAVNDGPNNLHSDMELGYHKQMYDATVSDNSVTFSLKDTDGNMGFPGNKNVSVKYTLTDENELKIDYNVTSDKNTLINMTNHSYFNLAGHASGSILNHKLAIYASAYTPVISGAIPTGEIAKVAGTPFDFTTPEYVGARIEEDNEQLKIGHGYDHNWVLDNNDGTIRKAAEVTEETSGRKMEVFTDQPGIQFYAGNCIEPHTGKQGAAYVERTGLALETQVFPNSINQDNFPDCIYGPGKDYKTTTIYKFTW